MALMRIIRWLGNSFIICAFLMAVTAIFALLMLDAPTAISLSVITLSVGVLGVIFVATTYNISNSSSKETSADALLFLLLFWGIMPGIMALPYILAALVSLRLLLLYWPP